MTSKQITIQTIWYLSHFSSQKHKFLLSQHCCHEWLFLNYKHFTVRSSQCRHDGHKWWKNYMNFFLHLSSSSWQIIINQWTINHTKLLHNRKLFMLIFFMYFMWFCNRTVIFEHSKWVHNGLLQSSISLLSPVGRFLLSEQFFFLKAKLHASNFLLFEIDTFKLICVCVFTTSIERRKIGNEEQNTCVYLQQQQQKISTTTEKSLKNLNSHDNLMRMYWKVNFVNVNYLPRNPLKLVLAQEWRAMEFLSISLEVDDFS